MYIGLVILGLELILRAAKRYHPETLQSQNKANRLSTWRQCLDGNVIFKSLLKDKAEWLA